MLGDVILKTGVIRQLKRLKKVVYRPKKYSMSDVILVAGTGRSGTTWLIELMNIGREYRVMFEPFNKNISSKLSHVKTAKPYVDPGEIFEYKNEYESLLRGGLDNSWVDTVNSTNKKASKQIVKEIRLNRMLGWLQYEYPELKIVYIVRDPYSAAYSGAEGGWMNASISKHLPPEKFAKKYFTHEQLDAVSKAKSKFQKNIATWAIENFLVLKHLQRNSNVHSVFYERLAMDTESELQKIAAFCRHTYIPAGESAKKKSALARSTSVIDTSSKEFGNRWKGNITREDDDYAKRVLKVFSLDKLYKARNKPACAEPFEYRV